MIKDEISGNGYDLSINKYKKAKYVMAYTPMQEILTELRRLEKQIIK